jgi:hypothetical protein
VIQADLEVAVKFVGKHVKFPSIEPLLTPTSQLREHRIAQLRRAVESGTYRVSTEQIATKMLRGLRSIGSCKVAAAPEMDGCQHLGVHKAAGVCLKRK